MRKARVPNSIRNPIELEKWTWSGRGHPTGLILLISAKDLEGQPWLSARAVVVVGDGHVSLAAPQLRPNASGKCFWEGSNLDLRNGSGFSCFPRLQIRLRTQPLFPCACRSGSRC